MVACRLTGSPAAPLALLPRADRTWSAYPSRPKMLWRGMDAELGNDADQRLLRIGISMSSIFSSRTGSNTAQATFGSTLTRK